METVTRFAEDRWVWICALGCFVLAGLTGALFRFSAGYGVVVGLDLGNIRHAHSHLMYLGWATPALFALIARQLPGFAGPARKVIGATLAAALLAYPLFLAFGYQPVAFGGARVPLAAVAAGLNMLVWYVFAGLYVQARRGLSPTRARLLWDMALTFLLLATLGAWGLTLLKPLGLDGPAWSTALIHVFLDLFSEGWFVLAVLGLAYAALRPAGQGGGHWSLWLVGLGLLVTFALGMPASFVPPVLKMLARFSAALVAVGLLVNVWILWKALRGGRRGLWRLPLMLLAVKLIVQLIVSVWPGAWWAEMHTLRVFYLHLMLLGFVTLGLVAAATSVWGRAATRGHLWMSAAVLLVIASLVPMTPIWPMAWRGAWIGIVVAWAALGPVLAAAGMLAQSIAGDE